MELFYFAGNTKSLGPDCEDWGYCAGGILLRKVVNDKMKELLL